MLNSEMNSNWKIKDILKEDNNLASHEKDRGYIKGGYHFFFLEDQKEMFFDYHYHTFHKCIIIIEGKLDYTVEGREYSLSGGDILWVPSYEAHKVQIHGSHNYKRIIVYLSENFIKLLSPIFNDLILNMGKDAPNHIKLSKEKFLSLIKWLPFNTLENKKSDIIDQNPYLLTQFIGWMNEYFKMIEHPNKENNQIINDEIVQRSIDYIQDHLTEELVIDEIAKHVYLSRYHFMRRFKTYLGKSVYQYILRERLALSRTLMKKGVNLTAISYEIGFKDYSTFARAFKKVYNKSPREFQKLDPTLDIE